MDMTNNSNAACTREQPSDKVGLYRDEYDAGMESLAQLDAILKLVRFAVGAESGALVSSAAISAMEDRLATAMSCFSTAPH